MLFSITIKRFTFLFGCLFFAAFLLSCKDSSNKGSSKNISSESIQKGKVLAIKYCQSCHLLPDPSLLDAKTWEQGVLPSMGPRLGIFYYGFQEYPSFKNDVNVDPGFYPKQPVLSFNEWQNIIDYYVATAPDSLPAQERKHSIQNILPLFSVEQPKFSFNEPATLFIKINGDSSYSLIATDALRQKIYFFNKQLDVKDSIGFKGPIVDINFIEKKMIVCDIGVLNPNNGKFGSVASVNITSKNKTLNDSFVLFDSLRRPVQLISADLNQDGKSDYLVCEFGNLKGELSWMQGLGNNKFSKHTLMPLPGAIRAYITDYNHDGLPDIWALFAQGEEGVFLFTNKGQGNFEAKELLRFPPSYGSSYFELDDFNKDGYPDIVYTCGDNADFSPILKPYHGVYIFLNDGSNHFQQKFFFPINGCYKAIAKDFDNDGDLDIATISFFADYEHQPEESFVYLENRGNFDFYPYSFDDSKLGRWLTMDAGDIDGDGLTDIILGNFSQRGVSTRAGVDWKKSPPFIVLKNTGKK